MTFAALEEVSGAERREIPDGWRIENLDTVATVERGKFSARPRNDPRYFDGGNIPFVQTGDVAVAGRYLRSASQFINDQGLEISKLFPSGTIFITIAANIGDVAIARYPVACTDSVVGINAYPEVCGTAWLFYLLSNSKEYFDSKATQNAQKNINLQVLKPFSFVLPPLPEQQKIAAILTAVDDKLDVIARQISATQTLKQGLMQTLFTRGVGTPDTQGRWHPHTAFQDTELGRIPVGWRVQTVGDVCEVKGGKRLPKGESLTEENTGFPYVRVTDMHMGGVRKEGVLYVPAHLQPLIKRYTISKDDIFISVAGTLGLVGTIPPELDGANLTENADKLTNITINRDYLLYCLCSPSIQAAISKEATANAQPKLALERIRGFKIPIPTTAEQQKIANAFKSADDKLTTLTTKQTHYQSLKRGLMQKLLTGAWRVRVDPN